MDVELTSTMGRAFGVGRQKDSPGFSSFAARLVSLHLTCYDFSMINPSLPLKILLSKTPSVPVTINFANDHWDG